MRLQKLRLENFQGIKNLEINMDGKNGFIFGENATGKSTIYNAFTWLLFDKPSTGAKNFTPKTRSLDGEVHYLNHSAEAVFDVLTIKKNYHEIYVKKRGSIEEEFTGHTTDYYLNGMPVSIAEYNSTLEKYCGTPEQSKMLTMLDYFPEVIGWADRRRLLIEICGDVNDADVIACNKSLIPLTEYLRKYGSVDAYKKIAIARKQELNRVIQEIPTRIDEARNSIPDTTGINKETLMAEKDTAFNAVDDLIAQRTNASNGNDSLFNTAISNIELKMAQMRTARAENNSGLTADIGCSIKQIRVELNNLQSAKSLSYRKLMDLNNSLKAKQDGLRTNNLYYMNTNAMEWDSSNGSCPMCHRPLQEDKIDAMQKAFQQNKNDKLKMLLDNEKQFNESILILERSIAAADAEHKANIEAEIAKDKELQDAIFRFEEINKTIAPIEEDPEFKKLTAEKEGYCDQNLKAMLAKTETVNDINKKISIQQQIIADTSKKLSLFDVKDNQAKRVVELETLKDQYNIEYSQLDRNINLCEQFMRTKVSMMNERINSRFRKVRFRLFQQQINGGLAEDCEVMVPTAEGDLIPYNHANHGARINASLEIIDVLASAWGRSVPLFIDNAESVTHIDILSIQTIQLIVSAMDNTLRFEFV